ncbi:hypothetical protein EV702DRAFT_1087183 [Suillus placidus]|uniref:Uncharacterized protein n=1 Tax=Suillus placidus TaxID=48579 RepID=A0A9P7D5H4_9AGAM|nr:hypothetical protein EV702DRAFT_1087183 [Suillus placidus]
MAKSLIRVGHVVLFAPTRQVFATSSGSFTKKPAEDKKRPCIIVSHDAERDAFALSPLCGAKLTTAGYVIRDQMEPKWWHPVHIVNGNVKVPLDGATVERKPIILTHYNPLVTELPTHYKPSFMWIGDPGEFVSNNDVQKLDHVTSLNIDEEQLKRLEDEWKYCLANHPPTPQ